MEANNVSTSARQKICRLCNQRFEPHPKVKARHQVCRRQACQQLRQKLNHDCWLQKNPIDYKKWYQDYGKTWRQENPDYQKQHRRQKLAKSQLPRQTPDRQLALTNLQANPAEKKEQLTETKTILMGKSGPEKKEPLNHKFYLLKAQALELVPLTDEKKEQLAFCFA